MSVFLRGHTVLLSERRGHRPYPPLPTVMANTLLFLLFNFVSTTLQLNEAPLMVQHDKLI